jgi:transitional endoplasmic reticulum ATPase
MNCLQDQFNFYYTKATEAKKSGENGTAARFYRLSANPLLKMAQENKEPLQSSQIKHANRILSIASELEADSKNKPEEKIPLPEGRASKTSPSGEDDGTTKFVAAETPGIGFDDVAGMDDVKAIVREKITNYIKYPKLFKKFNVPAEKGIMLFGIPGTGKTTMAKAIANEIGAKIIIVKASDLASKWFGDAEKNTRNVFQAAKEEKGPIVITFEDFDSLGSRSTNSSVVKRVVTEMLAQMDDLDGLDKTVLVIITTNRPTEVDTAFRRSKRFNERIPIPLPDYEARKYLAERSFIGVPASGIDFDSIAQRTEGFNGADVAVFCENIRLKAVNRCIANGGNEEGEAVTQSDIDNCEFTSSVDPGDVERINKYLNSLAKNAK